MSTSSHLSVGSLNFGAINDNPFEFVNRNDTQLQEYFDLVYEAFRKTSQNTDTLYQYLTHAGIYDTVTYDALFDEANSFCRKYLTPETLSILMNSDAEFDLGKCHMSSIFENLLIKDKGIGGFEQINSKRTCNIVRNHQNITDLKLLQTHITVFLETYKTPLKDGATYQEYFLKGRKEGPKVDGVKTQKNYYNPEVMKQRTPEDDAHYDSLGKLILITFDILQYDMFNSGPLPGFFKGEQSNTNERKIQLLLEYILTNDFDIVFLQEFLPNSIKFPNTSKYSIVYGEELHGQCNAIIYKSNLGRAEIFGIYDSPSLANRIDDDGEIILQNYDQYKELPLVLGIQKNNVTTMVLVSYHSGGKGILGPNKTFADSDLYKFMEYWKIPVIVGADVNCNIRDSLGKVDEQFTTFPHIDDFAYTTFKERSPLQAQFDKVGKLDKKVKDCIMTMNCNMQTDISGVCMLNGTEITDKHDMSLCLPQYFHPFDHFILETHIYLREPSYFEMVINYIRQFLGF